MFSSGNSWYEFTPFLLICEGMLSLMFWMFLCMVQHQCSLNCEGKNADKKSLQYETKYYAYTVSFFGWENNLVSYPTATGTELPVSSDHHCWVSPALLSLLGVRRFLSALGHSALSPKLIYLRAYAQRDWIFKSTGWNFGFFHLEFVLSCSTFSQ